MAVVTDFLSDSWLALISFDVVRVSRSHAMRLISGAVVSEIIEETRI
jgi:hypothetical protein